MMDKEGVEHIVQNLNESPRKAIGKELYPAG